MRCCNVTTPGATFHSCTKHKATRKPKNFRLKLEQEITNKGFSDSAYRWSVINVAAVTWLHSTRYVSRTSTSTLYAAVVVPAFLTATIFSGNQWGCATVMHQDPLQFNQRAKKWISCFVTVACTTRGNIVTAKRSKRRYKLADLSYIYFASLLKPAQTFKQLWLCSHWAPSARRQPPSCMLHPIIYSGTQ